MRTPSIASVQYTPENPPDEPEAFRRWALSELQKVSAAIQLLALGHLDETFVAPAKPRNGDIRFADGTRWNPRVLMGGRGIYVYDGISASWIKLVAL